MDVFKLALRGEFLFYKHLLNNDFRRIINEKEDMKKRSRKLRKREREEKFKLDLNPEAKKDILAIFLLAVALISVLSLLGMAGGLGNYLSRFLFLAFGWGRFLIPLVLLIIGFVYLKPVIKERAFSASLGLILLLVSILGLSYIFQPDSLSKGGGYLGLIVTFPFLKLLGFWASLIFFLAFLIISFLIIFNAPLSRILRKEEMISPEEMAKEGPEEHKESAFRNIAKKIFPPPEFEVKKVKSTEEQESSSGEELEIKPPVYHLPPLDLLESDGSRPVSGDIKTNSSIIHRTLESFGIKAEMAEVNVGPTVTQYTLRPSSGVKLSNIVARSQDLALALAAHPIRIEAPIPGRSLVGIEIPNKSVSTVRLKPLLESKEFKEGRKSNLNIILGKDVKGAPVFGDLQRMPHLLVAGSTGTGKTVCLNTLIFSLIYQNSPQVLRFILIDPKRVEFSAYNNCPHLLAPVITDAEKTINALKWSVSEMERRFRVLQEAGARDIFLYNREQRRKKKEILPFLVIIIDELADLMGAYGREIEGAIVRLAQMARAVGIHLVVSTQRPSVEVITGLIKANITSRIAFQVASQVDSRTILDLSGAEKLLGRGDMLYLAGDTAKPRRVQGTYISEKEVKRLTDYLREKKEVDYNESIVEFQAPGSQWTGHQEIIDDPMYEEAKEVVSQAQKASASLLQRRLRVGYARAARLLDLLEERGVIGPADGAKPRQVLVKKEE